MGPRRNDGWEWEQRRAHIWSLYRAGILDDDTATIRLLLVDRDQRRACAARARVASPTRIAQCSVQTTQGPLSRQRRRVYRSGTEEWVSIRVGADGEAEAELWWSDAHHGGPDGREVTVERGPEYLLVANLDRAGWSEREGRTLPEGGQLRWFSRRKSSYDRET